MVAPALARVHTLEPAHVFSSTASVLLAMAKREQRADLYVLAHLDGGPGPVFFYRGDLAAELGVCPRTVARHLAGCPELDYRPGTGREGCEVSLRIPPDSPNLPRPRPPVEKPPEPGPRPVQPVSPGGDRECPPSAPHTPEGVVRRYRSSNPVRDRESERARGPASGQVRAPARVEKKVEKKKRRGYLSLPEAIRTEQSSKAAAALSEHAVEWYGAPARLEAWERVMGQLAAGFAEVLTVEDAELGRTADRAAFEVGFWGLWHGRCGGSFAWGPRVAEDPLRTLRARTLLGPCSQGWRGGPGNGPNPHREPDPTPVWVRAALRRLVEGAP